MSPTRIDPFSAKSLFIEMVFEETILGTGTGFVVERNDKKYLITNWHLVSGRNPINNELLDQVNAAVPNKIRVWHQANGHLGRWIPVTYELLDGNNNPKWLEHTNGQSVDVIALNITPVGATIIDFYPIDLSLADVDLVLTPSEPISIIGFPYGVSSGGKLPIWKTGHIASDLDINYNNQPIFLTDVTTKSGMSGSPVIARRVGMHSSSRGQVVGGGVTRFLGVYSGRVSDNGDGNDFNIGMVWKVQVIDEIISTEVLDQDVAQEPDSQ